MPEIAHPVDLRLSEKLKDPSYRKRFFLVEGSAKIAQQLIALRKRRGWSQTELAEKAQTKQPAISRAERADYHNWSFNALRAIADALDARIRVVIEPAEDVLAEYEEKVDTQHPVVEALARSQFSGVDVALVRFVKAFRDAFSGKLSINNANAPTSPMSGVATLIGATAPVVTAGTLIGNAIPAIPTVPFASGSFGVFGGPFSPYAPTPDRQENQRLQAEVERLTFENQLLKEKNWRLRRSTPIHASKFATNCDKLIEESSADEGKPILFPHGWNIQTRGDLA